MRVLIHCHGGPAIGVGHVFRAAALAEAALDRGHQVDFSGTFEGQLVTDRLAVLGVAVVDHPDLTAYDVVHIDTYQADGDDLAARVAGVAMLSNLEDGPFGRRPADLVVDPNLGAERSERTSGPVLLRGSRWAPLRRSVAALAGRAEIREQARRVLVVMGGTDVRGVTGAVLDVLAATRRDLAVTAIAQPARRELLAQHVAGLELEVALVPPRADLSGLMLEQDLVVTAAGTSVSELCCLGVPAALVCVSDNQRDGYARALEQGVAVGIGSAETGLDLHAGMTTLEGVLGDAEVRADLSRAATRAVDGLGAWRVVRSWEQLAAGSGIRRLPESVAVRRAVAADGGVLWHWRNDRVTRAASRSTGELDLDEHLAWLRRSLDDPDRRLLVASDKTGDIGTVRWDRAGDGEWEVSITVAPERRGESLAGPLLQAGEDWLATHEKSTHTMVAWVRTDNELSLRLFGSAGYLPVLPADGDGFVCLLRQRVPTA